MFFLLRRRIVSLLRAIQKRCNGWQTHRTGACTCTSTRTRVAAAIAGMGSGSTGTDRSSTPLVVPRVVRIMDHGGRMGHVAAVRIAHVRKYDVMRVLIGHL